MSHAQRKPQRLKNYDYSQDGLYYLTVCTGGRLPILGGICRGGPTQIDGTRKSPAAPSVGQIVGAWKSLTASEWLKRCKSAGVHMGAFWQRGYYDHVIRSEEEYFYICRYIEENPLRWSEDEYHL